MNLDTTEKLRSEFMSYNIYLVEDEKNLNDILTFYLEKENWNVTSFFNGTYAQSIIDNPPHLWVLDIMLPDIDGIQLLKEIKERTPDVPIIFISARNSDMDRIMGLEMGSDDYLSKPFLPRELVIRVKKILERVYKGNDITDEEIIIVDSYKINKKKRNIMKDGEFVEITSKEFDLILLLIDSTGQALSREQILDNIWGDDYFGSDRAVDNLVKRLRKKMPHFKIETIYGYGYRRV